MQDMTGSELGSIVLGGFEILEELGTGAYATAYLAKQLGSERQAVVKIAHSHLVKQELGEMIRSRFAAEFRALTRVNHPNLVTIFTAGETNSGLPAIAMEYIHGKTLHEVFLEHAPLPMRASAEIFMQLVSALAAVHSAGVVHRDVTPSNVILTRGHDQRLCVKLLDFGIAQLNDTEGMHTLGPIGTPRYLSPEQFDGQASSSSDMFSIGSMLWWAFTGTEFMHDVTSLSELFRRLSRSTPPDPREQEPALSPAISALIQDLLQQDPESRPTAQEFLDNWKPTLSSEMAHRSHDDTSASSPPQPTTAFQGRPTPSTFPPRAHQHSPHTSGETPSLPPNPQSHTFQRTPSTRQTLAPQQYAPQPPQHAPPHTLTGAPQYAVDPRYPQQPPQYAVDPRYPQQQQYTVDPRYPQQQQYTVDPRYPQQQQQYPADSRHSLPPQHSMQPHYPADPRHSLPPQHSMQPHYPADPRHSLPPQQQQQQQQYPPYPRSPHESGAFSRPHSGAFSRPQSGAFSRPQSGAFSRPQSGAFPRPQSGAFPRPQSGAFPRPQSGTFAPVQARVQSPSYTELVMHFVGVMPEWLIELTEAVETYDYQRRQNLCQAIAQLATSLGASRLEQHAKSLAALPHTAPIETLDSFIENLEMEYARVFRVLKP